MTGIFRTYGLDPWIWPYPALSFSRPSPAKYIYYHRLRLWLVLQYFLSIHISSRSTERIYSWTDLSLFSISSFSFFPFFPFYPFSFILFLPGIYTKVSIAQKRHAISDGSSLCRCILMVLRRRIVGARSWTGFIMAHWQRSIYRCMLYIDREAQAVRYSEEQDGRSVSCQGDLQREMRLFFHTDDR